MPLTLEKLRQALPLLLQAARRMIVPLDGTLYLPTSPSSTSVPSDVRDAAWEPLQRGDPWGQQWQTVWLKQPLAIPPELHDQPIYFHLKWREDANQWSSDMIESQVFLDDVPFAGLDAEHRLAPLPSLDRPIDLFVQAHVNRTQPFGGFELVVLDEPTQQLAHTFRVALDTLPQLNPGGLAHSAILQRLNHAYALLDLREGTPSTRFYDAVRGACDYLDQHLTADLVGGARPQITVTGHAHIDVAWLWPLWRTRQKAAHTFSTALRLMEQYPEFHFTASTPQLYQFVKEDHPALYEQIKARIAEGRWEATGAMWLEADCNLPSGESLVRQFVHGMRFFADEFGIRDRVLWLPDVFGYSAALPQIMHGCGIDTFMTTKISWSQFNRMPCDTFRWRGIDGTEVLTHFVTTPQPDSTIYTYNGAMTPADVAGAWREYRQKAINTDLLYLMGYGDGGGGPTPPQLETVRRLTNMPEVPQVRYGSARDYFEQLHERVDSSPHLPTWVGELYLEYHRGTYTSQAWIKQANRRAEHVFHDAEFLDAWATATVPGYEGQRARLNEGWHLILLNQFHDIIPGSSIAPVYAEAREHYAEIQRIGHEVRDAALAALMPSIDAPLVVVNTLGHDRSDPIVVPAASHAHLLPHVAQQPVTLLDGSDALLVTGDAVPAYSITAITSSDPVTAMPLRISERTLENQLYRIALDDRGEIESIYDKRHEREVLAPGQHANHLVAFEDRPLNYDAWDIDHFYEEKPYPVQNVQSMRVIEDGPIRGGVEIVRSFLRSTIRQRILIYRDLPRIDFETEIDWHEHQMLLKTAFPVDVNASHATHEIQFGSVERPTHRNTSWDMARFETCAQRWVDLSEDGYGVALLNDAKYGHDIHDNVIRLTLLKSAIFPDPNADQGIHRFTYSLLPHAGDWRAGEVVRRALELNAPMLGGMGQGSGGKTERTSSSFVACDAPHVVVDTIKTAEDGDGLIVRLYEAHNRRGEVALTFAKQMARAEECNLLEERTGDVIVDAHVVRFPVKPFEIKTLRVWLQH